MPYKDLAKRREKNRRWRLNNPGYHAKYMNKYRVVNKDYFREYARSHPDNLLKRRARNKLNYEIIKGNVTRPSVCDDCQKESRIEAHHRDYGKPLEVEWLCRRCHLNVHLK